MSRFVHPASVVLTLSQGDSLTVKARLNTGEERAMFSRMYRPPDADGRSHIDPMQTNMARVLAYLLDWTLVDDAGQLVEIRDRPAAAIEDTLNALDPEDFSEIRKAIDAHIARTEAERADKKKVAPGAPAFSAISTSLAAATGGSNGSPSLTPTSTP